MFSMAVWRVTIAAPLHWRAGWQNGSLPRPIALKCVLLPRNCPLVNYPNQTMSEATARHPVWLLWKVEVLMRRFLSPVILLLFVTAARAADEPRKNASVEGVTEYRLSNGARVLL